eukprot:CAMPEP_0202822168 /NCGR_PEP_ID=MMETSP1389-20130828/10881_1 /ASSEMBLY_ACC=CAM_ASM_000865 /TAXON_ID=302021 /ORGANISM="Rhodomonas sp., Strain CCMP768" /LENGTH=64 /DNA_ID=CAMNT_0049495041 /DNA_START=178 /DNA_END=369 /DNA_ORIENTATION=+
MKAWAREVTTKLNPPAFGCRFRTSSRSAYRSSTRDMLTARFRTPVSSSSEYPPPLSLPSSMPII